MLGRHLSIIIIVIPSNSSDKTKMAESEPIKIKLFDYQKPKNVEAEVPGAQKLRAAVHNENGESEVSSQDTAIDTFHEEPVIVVTRKEATFTKGDLKLQKVTVTEDISLTFQHLFRKQTMPGKTVVTQIQKFDYKY